MATAEKIQQVVRSESVDLHLSVGEAEVIKGLVGNLLGGQESGLRDITSSVYHALDDAGVKSSLSPFIEDCVVLR